MLPRPKWTEFPKYPVVTCTALLAIGASVAWWAHVDVSLLFASAMIRQGELWRLVTSIFPHVNFLHLAFNIYWLWVLGTPVERAYGHRNTAALFAVLALGSSALEFGFAQGGVGLSGVGYGLFGLLWVLSRHDDRFREAMDSTTILLFIGWFILCIVATVDHVFAVGNVAHGAGAALGILIGFALALPARRVALSTGIGAILVFGLWASTFGRPMINLSRSAGYEEARWGYDAAMAHRNQEAVLWLRDAVAYQPRNGLFWCDLGFAYHSLGDSPAALDAYRKAAERGNGDAQYFLGTLYETGQEGLPKDSALARFWYGKAASQNGAEVLNNVAWAYATSSEPAIRNPVAALECARKANSLDKDPNPSHLDTLAEAYYVNQQHKDAVETEMQAVALAPPDQRSHCQESLEKYQRALANSRRGSKGK